MTFIHDKKTFLEKADKSKKGEVDEQINDLVNKINSNPNYYTTSSCAGRIVLITKVGNKYEAEWLFSSHNKISYDELVNSLTQTIEEDIYKDIGEVELQGRAGLTPESRFYFLESLIESALVSNNPEKALEFKEERTEEETAALLIWSISAYFSSAGKFLVTL